MQHVFLTVVSCSHMGESDPDGRGHDDCASRFPSASFSLTGFLPAIHGSVCVATACSPHTVSHQANVVVCLLLFWLCNTP